QQPPGVALVLGGGEEEKLGGDELVAAPGRFLVREVEEVVQVARDGDVAALALDLRQAPDGFLERLLERRHVDPGALQERGGARVLLVQEREQKMLRLDEAAVVGEREALGVGERLLELGGELVDPHGVKWEWLAARRIFRWGRGAGVSRDFGMVS